MGDLGMTGMVRHFLELFSLSPDEARGLIDRALARKHDEASQGREPILAGRTLGLLFEKPSLRTRVSFEAAIAQLGGYAIFLNNQDVGLGRRESVSDFSRVISQYVDALAVRTYAHATVRELAEHASIPVINALCDSAHPCQAMADMMTIREEIGRLDGVRLAFVGDGNNVARSLAVASALLGLDFVLACPEGYAFPEEFQAAYAESFGGRSLEVLHDPVQGVQGADVVYTDVWASMGQEAQAEERRAVFTPFRVDESLMEHANPSAIFLHCLPAHRGEEVAASVLDGPRSRVIPQAANRLHFQKELLVWLLLGDGASLAANGRLGHSRPSSSP